MGEEMLQKIITPKLLWDFNKIIGIFEQLLADF